MATREKVDSVYARLKRKAQKHMRKGRIPDALHYIYNASLLMVQACTTFADEDLESIINETAHELISTNDYEPEYGKILFYDCFSLDNRVFSRIFLNALITSGLRVVYVCYSQNIRSEGKVIYDMVQKSNNVSLREIDAGSYLENIRALDLIVKEERPEKVLLQMAAWYDIAQTVFAAYEGKIERFNIAITSMAFWLGTTVCDFNIDTRDADYLFSRDYRNINEEKLIKLPCYFNSTGEFKGFPFSIINRKLIVSGGRVIKIKGSDVFFRIVEHILSNYDDTVFLYLDIWFGEPDRPDGFADLSAKFKDRFYVLSNRDDLDEILKRCYFYLDTYPVVGGNMIRQAVSNGKLPIGFNDNVGVCTDKDTAVFADLNQFFIKTEGLKMGYNTLSELYEEINKLMCDEEYYNMRCKETEGRVISEEQFNSELLNILFNHQSSFKCEHSKVYVGSYFDNHAGIVYLRQFSRLALFDKLLLTIPKEHRDRIFFIWAKFRKILTRQKGR